MRLNLDRQQIERLASNNEVFRRGFALNSEGKVSDILMEEGSGAFNIKSTVDGTYDSYKVSASFDAAGLLRKYVCECAAFGVWRGACKHVVAVLLRTLEQWQKQALNARRAKASTELLDLFEQQAFSEIEETMSKTLPPTNPVSIEPTLCSETAGECYLMFKIGRQRKYVIKDIAEFIKYLDNEIEIPYGKDFLFNHQLSAFDNDSLAIIKLIRDEREVFDKATRQNKYGYYSSANNRRLILSPHGLDKFFEISPSKVLANFGATPYAKQLMLTDLPLPPLFKLSKRENGVSLSLSGEKALLFLGESGRYAFHNDAFHKIENGAYSVLAPIFASFKRLGEQRVLFTEQELNRVSAYVLPKLLHYGLTVTSQEFNENISNIEYTKKAYLDTQDDTVSCRAVLCNDMLETDILFPPQQPPPLFNIEAYKFKAMLLRMGFTQTNGQFILSGDDFIFDFYYSLNGLEELRGSAEIFISDAFKGITLKPKRKTSFGLRINGALLEISVDSEYSKYELMEILEAYRLKKRFHRLKDGSFVDLNEPGNNLDAVNDLFNGLSLTDKDFEDGLAKVPKYRALYAGSVIDGRSELEDAVDEGFRKLVNDFKKYRDLEFEVPKELSEILRSYQKEGYKWLKTLAHYGFGGILADDMGLGKTLQVISILLSDKTAENKPSIVVAPTSLIYNWEKEIHKFAPQLNATVIAGAATQRRELYTNEKNVDVWITTYDMLKRDIEQYADTTFKYIIADEAQNIKNPSTQNAKAIKLLKGETRFALTGTPIENALSELWSIFDFVMPNYLFNSAKFTKSYESPILKDNDKEAATQLKRHIAPFILRRLKTDVLTELPPKIETTLYAEMLPEQKKMYTAYLLKAKGELDNIVQSGTFNNSRIDILSKLTRLRQICCHPAVFAEDYNGGSGKLDLTLTSIDNFIETGHRILIFSQFTSMLSIIRKRLEEQKIEYFYLDGSTDSKIRMEMTDAFNDGEGTVFLISLKAGGSGLNLTGADVVIHYDPWWNPAVMSQASDRAHRIGQQKTVQVFNIVTKDTIEEKIIALQEKKRDLVDSVITEGAQFINKMEQADIVGLFG